MRTNKKSFNKWLSLASVSLLSAITLQAVDSEPVDAVTGEWQQENRIFSSVNEAMSYGQAHANWSQYKQYRVSYVGPRQFVLKWELRTPKKSSSRYTIRSAYSKARYLYRSSGRLLVAD